MTQLHYLQHIIGQGSALAVPGTPAGFTYPSLAWEPPPTYGVDFSYGF